MTKKIDFTVPKEFEHYLDVMKFGARKHGSDNWLEVDGIKSSFKDMHCSMLHHLAQSAASGGLTPEEFAQHVAIGAHEASKFGRLDHESRLDSLLHLIARAQMTYTKMQLGHYKRK